MYFKIKHLIVILNMNYYRKILLVVAGVFLLGFASCQEDDSDVFNEDNLPQPYAFTYKASINGTAWVATQNVSLLVKNSSSSPSKEMRILANSSDGKQLSIKLADASTGIAGDGIAVKTYNLVKGGTSDVSFSYSVNGSNLYTGAYGLVTITKSDAANKKITGTFSCTLFKSAGDTLRVTGGIIADLPYTILEQ
ncbi:hypothetical protein AEM51_08290 [Bacteroidetes bacterium UKL13-3]|jgi:hypothetical protein|nr:hypothetical protein AEM51_08290 [Bacteroidetes bacterium UKL13-3]HCP94281.1 hypothetical protein [Bacteroidota bacterium]